MCDIGDIDVCAVWNETRPRARRRHVCDLCGLAIAPGVVYLRVGALYDGAWTTYRMHEDCGARASVRGSRAHRALAGAAARADGRGRLAGAEVGMTPDDRRALARLLEELERVRYDLRVVVGTEAVRDRDLDEAIEDLDIPRLLLELDPRSGR